MSGRFAPDIPLLPLEEYERQQRRQNSPHGMLWDVLDAVYDPEIPAISIWDLGVLQDVQVIDEAVVVTITPTYSGCPAMAVMAEDVGEALDRAGHHRFRVETRLAPAWTTSWLSSTARNKLRAYGIAPPGVSLTCPQCGSSNVSQISEFGSTACKALYRCDACAEPFDYFKAI